MDGRITQLYTFILSLFILFCNGCISFPSKNTNLDEKFHGVEKTENVLFYIDQFTLDGSSEKQKFFVVDDPCQVAILVNAIAMMKTENAVDWSWLGPMVTLDFIDSDRKTIVSVDVSLEGDIILLRNKIKLREYYYNRILCLTVYGFMENFAKDVLLDYRKSYIDEKKSCEQQLRSEHHNKTEGCCKQLIMYLDHMLSVYPWNSLVIREASGAGEASGSP